ncbi:MAG: hypothetical protein Q9220_001899 [cf. Caloplaca sp. 1 TL-2023]
MSTFLPIRQQAQICLRCQYRLATGIPKSSRTPKSPQKKPQRREFSTWPQRLQQHVRVNDDHSRDPFISDYATSSQNRLQQEEEDDIKLPEEESSGGKERGNGIYFKRADLYSRENLGTTTLGKPAEVLRVRDRIPRPRDRTWSYFQGQDSQQLNGPIEPLTSSEIYDRVGSERGIVSTERANKNIQTLKQEWSLGLEEQDLAPLALDCEELRRRLLDGFTTSQLLGYWKSVLPSGPGGLLDLDKPFRSASMKRSDWRAGITPFPGDAVQRLQDVARQSHYQGRQSAKTSIADSAINHASRTSKDTVKSILVDKIIRQAWNIRAREEIESIGEIDIQIDEAHLELISNHKRDILRQLAVEFNAKIDTFKAGSLLRITANQATCASSLRLLLMILEDIACHDLNLEQDRSAISQETDDQARLNDSLLREVGQLCSTVVRWLKFEGSADHQKSRRLSIYYLKNDRQSLDHTQQLLGELIRPTSTTAIGAFTAGSSKSSADLIAVPIEVSKSLPLVHRGTEWARMNSFTNDKSKKPPNQSQSSTEADTSKALSGISDHIQVSESLEMIRKYSREHEFWQPEVFQDSSAIVGYLLYPAGNILSKPRSASSFPESSNHRVFQTDVPSLRRTIERHRIKTKIKEELHIQLKANNRVSATKPEEGNPPDLELRLATDPQDLKVSLKNVRLVLEDKQADLLLPQQPVDLRFASQRYINAKDICDPKISDWIDQNNLDLGDINELKTPTNLTINMPRRLFLSGQESNEADTLEVSVDYSVASIEYRAILHARPARPPGVKQFSLSYSCIDGGPIGGRRQELRIYDNRALEFASASADKGDETQKESIVNALFAYTSEFIKDLKSGGIAGKRSSRLGRAERTVRTTKRMAMRGRLRTRHDRTRQDRMVVRRRWSDIPLRSREAERRLDRLPLRKVRVDRDVPGESGSGGGGQRSRGKKV